MAIKEKEFKKKKKKEKKKEEEEQEEEGICQWDERNTVLRITVENTEYTTCIY